MYIVHTQPTMHKYVNSRNFAQGMRMFRNIVNKIDLHYLKLIFEEIIHNALLEQLIACNVVIHGSFKNQYEFKNANDIGLYLDLYFTEEPKNLKDAIMILKLQGFDIASTTWPPFGQPELPQNFLPGPSGTGARRSQPIYRPH